MNDTPDDLITLSQAAKLVPSPRGGRTHLSTLYRWIESGRLPFVQQGRWKFVSRADVLALLQPGVPRRKRREQAPDRAADQKRSAETQRILREAGII